jgi:hypothetical protein
MTIRQVVTGLLVISLGVCSLPAAAETSSDRFRASVDRAMTSTAKDAATGLRPSTGSMAFARASGAGQAQATGGGGLSKVSLIMTLVGTAAGAYGTYYMIKQMKKLQTNPPGSNGQ